MADQQMPDPATEREHRMANAIRAVNQKKSVPEIDFTLHQMDDGTTVSTQERVCKGKTASLVDDKEEMLMLDRRPSPRLL